MEWESWLRDMRICSEGDCFAILETFWDAVAKAKSFRS